MIGITALVEYFQFIPKLSILNLGKKILIEINHILGGNQLGAKGIEALMENIKLIPKIEKLELCKLEYFIYIYIYIGSNGVDINAFKKYGKYINSIKKFKLFI